MVATLTPSTILLEKLREDKFSISIEEVDQVLKSLDRFTDKAMIDFWLDVRSDLTNGG